jgi:hypothetical protein
VNCWTGDQSRDGCRKRGTEDLANLDWTKDHANPDELNLQKNGEQLSWCLLECVSWGVGQRVIATVEHTTARAMCPGIKILQCLANLNPILGDQSARSMRI